MTVPLIAGRFATSCNGVLRDHVGAVLTIEIRAEDVEDLPGLISEVRRAVKRGSRGEDLQFCSGAARFHVAIAEEVSERASCPSGSGCDPDAGTVPGHRDICAILEVWI